MTTTILKPTLIGLAILVAGMLCWAAPAAATPMFAVDFSGMPPGLPPMTAAAVAGQVNTMPTSFAAPTGTSILAQNTYTDSLNGTVFGNGNVVVMSDNSDALSTPASQSCSLSFNGHNNDAASSGKVLVSFDMLLDSAFTANSFFYGYDTAGKGISYLMFSAGSGNVALGSYSSPGSGLTTQTANSVFTRGASTHIDLLLDLDHGTQSLSVDGVLRLTGTLPFGTNVDAFAFGTGSTSVIRMAVDNFTVTAVPEPSTCWLIVLGAAALSLRLLAQRFPPFAHREKRRMSHG